MRVFLLYLLGLSSGFTFPKMRTTSVKLKAQKTSTLGREYWTISDLYDNIKRNNVEIAAFLDSGKKIKVLDKNGYTHVINTMENNIVSLEDLLTKNCTFSNTDQEVKTSYTLGLRRTAFGTKILLHNNHIL